MLNGSVIVERHVRENDLVISSGGVIVTEDCYTNAPGEVVAAHSTNDRLAISWALAEPGTVRLDAIGSNVVALTEYCGGAQMPVSLPREWVCGADDEADHEFLAVVTNFSATGNVGAFTLTFTPDDPTASTLTRTADLQVVKIRVEAEVLWPSNRVRHVFGPKEKFTISSNPQVELSVEAGSYAGVDGATVTAPDRGGAFHVLASIGQFSCSLDFDCIIPTKLNGRNPRDWNAYEWTLNQVPPFIFGEAGVAMHIDTWLEPLYVSFSHLRLFEGYAPTSNRTGWYQDYSRFPESYLEHGTNAGAGDGTNVGSVAVTANENLTDGGDCVASWIGACPAYTNGSYQLVIPLKWFAVGGGITNSLPSNLQTAWVYSNGTMRIQKNGVTWERALTGYSGQVR